MNVVNDNTEKQFDYAEYGYKEGTPITIDSELFGKIGELIQYMGQKETTIGFESKENLEETLGEGNRAMQVLSPQGIQALAIALQMNEIHEKNVRSGVAVHRDELEKTTKISLQD